ncbi:hypothetical protein LEP1GSC193_2357 [Leptospira alstonii serovar Pingchang str. 80-412]|uniref:Uncharacterized protein n=2 Tax=Leptospira alstonii TaxID=28452 RepID=M6D2A0_9LEPT|nr:hypothetical protein LEP1GSC194_2394 [Leptospira alstonii serovar Sichuan str. 79601]EQA81048.1 hypothetical protein LEP1GSC193_2357 [Leptospira alstonii serovar Pingchang str. 80-412]
MGSEQDKQFSFGQILRSKIRKKILKLYGNERTTDSFTS